MIFAKTKSPLNLAHFRLVNLISCVTKTISKALTLRLKDVIRSVIGIEQCTFISRRYIFDGSLVMNEVISCTTKSNKRVLVFKVKLTNHLIP